MQDIFPTSQEPSNNIVITIQLIFQSLSLFNSWPEDGTPHTAAGFVPQLCVLRT